MGRPACAVNCDMCTKDSGSCAGPSVSTKMVRSISGCQADDSVISLLFRCSTGGAAWETPPNFVLFSRLLDNRPDDAALSKRRQ